MAILYFFNNYLLVFNISTSTYFLKIGGGFQVTVGINTVHILIFKIICNYITYLEKYVVKVKQ